MLLGDVLCVVGAIALLRIVWYLAKLVLLRLGSHENTGRRCIRRACVRGGEGSAARDLIDLLSKSGIEVVDSADVDALFLCDEVGVVEFALYVKRYLASASRRKKIVASVPISVSTAERFTDSLVHALQGEGRASIALVKHGEIGGATLSRIMLRALGTNFVADVDWRTVRWRLSRWIRAWRCHEW